jgi:polynucleotide 5'-hydroxyl-kinase GRC3/NOL9
MKVSAALAEELSSLPKPATVMVIGEVDTGKTTLVVLLARWLQSASRKVAIVDADIGQADIGPPGFVSYGLVEDQLTSLRSVTRQASYMVGNTSPYSRGLNLVAGIQACVRSTRRDGADVTLVDTGGPGSVHHTRCMKGGCRCQERDLGLS